MEEKTIEKEIIIEILAEEIEILVEEVKILEEEMGIQIDIILEEDLQEEEDNLSN